MADSQANGVEVNGAGRQTRSMRKRQSQGNPEDQSGKRPKLGDKTDHTRWRLRDDRGCQTWHYLEDDKAAKAWPQSLADKYFLGMPLVCLSICILHQLTRGVAGG